VERSVFLERDGYWFVGRRIGPRGGVAKSGAADHVRSTIRQHFGHSQNIDPSTPQATPITDDDVSLLLTKFVGDGTFRGRGEPDSEHADVRQPARSTRHHDRADGRDEHAGQVDPRRGERLTRWTVSRDYVSGTLPLVGACSGTNLTKFDDADRTTSHSLGTLTPVTIHPRARDFDPRADLRPSASDAGTRSPRISASCRCWRTAETGRRGRPKGRKDTREPARADFKKKPGGRWVKASLAGPFARPAHCQRRSNQAFPFSSAPPFSSGGGSRASVRGRPRPPGPAIRSHPDREW